jgi:transcriptional regulator of arginine metabolism
MKKNDRLELIRKIVQENKITTQGELVKLLQNEGLKATQATVSRDINEIGITKVPTEDGSYIYGLSTVPRRVGGTSVAPRRLLRVDRQHAFMNIVVQPGTSRLIKKILLDEYKQFDGVPFVGSLQTLADLFQVA